jgi:hypothetical protein
MAETDQDDSDEHSAEAEAESDALQRPKASPLTGTDHVGRRRAQKNQQTTSEHEDTELPLGDHNEPRPGKNRAAAISAL